MNEQEVATVVDAPEVCISKDEKSGCLQLNNVISCLQSRLSWYCKAIDMFTGTIKWDNHFDWPDNPQSPRVLPKWRGAVRELKNTLDMLSTVKE